MRVPEGWPGAGAAGAMGVAGGRWGPGWARALRGGAELVGWGWVVMATVGRAGVLLGRPSLDPAPGATNGSHWPGCPAAWRPHGHGGGREAGRGCCCWVGARGGMGRRVEVVCCRWEGPGCCRWGGRVALGGVAEGPRGEGHRAEGRPAMGQSGDCPQRGGSPAGQARDRRPPGCDRGAVMCMVLACRRGSGSEGWLRWLRGVGVAPPGVAPARRRGRSETGGSGSGVRLRRHTPCGSGVGTGSRPPDLHAAGQNCKGSRAARGPALRGGLPPSRWAPRPRWGPWQGPPAASLLALRCSSRWVPGPPRPAPGEPAQGDHQWAGLPGAAHWPPSPQGGAVWGRLGEVGGGLRGQRRAGSQSQLLQSRDRQAVRPGRQSDYGW